MTLVDQAIFSSSYDDSQGESPLPPARLLLLLLEGGADDDDKKIQHLKEKEYLRYGVYGDI